MRLRLGVVAALLLTFASEPQVSLGAAAAGTVRAAYCYGYMSPSHVDSLAAHGFTRAIVHTISDSIDARSVTEFRGFALRSAATGLEFVPEWLFQSDSRLALRPAARRYTWGRGTIEAAVPCPLDSVYWQRAVFDAADSVLAAVPGVARVAVDLELYRDSRHHYDAGPCRCAACLSEYLVATPALAGRDPSRLGGLAGWEESRVAAFLRPMLRQFARRHPGVRLEVFDLDLDSFVHRALGRALARTAVPTTDYTERTYSTGSGSLQAARDRLRSIGLAATPLVGGLWLKRYSPAALVVAMHAIEHAADGVFLFTTYSLVVDASKLTGGYALQGDARDYWNALGSDSP